jgi:transcriptional regulator with GAF, ATPase, and Fis domain
MASDMETYADGLYRRLDRIPVLITGESGTGKEIAAHCVAWSRYIPFDAKKRRFVRRFVDDFHTRNLCELPPEIAASTLFGHRRGAFTGATADLPGLFSLPKEFGTLFLDEFGELPEHLQVALLRPLQSREIVPLGDTHPHPILGRHVFATNRDLPALCEEGKFRADLYQRINAMQIHLPPLRQRLADAPKELEQLVEVSVRALIDEPASVARWTERVANSIRAKLFDYPWPGNLRELNHYVERYVLTDGRMEPIAPRPRAAREPGPAGPAESTVLPSSGLLGPVAKEGKVSIEELNRDYVTRVYLNTGLNQTETARVTGLGWRKVGQMIDPVRLERLLEQKQRKDEEG